MNFNQSQISAIHHGPGPMMVLAGPGSGKTTVITMRTKTLIEEYKADPSSILVITFTRAAANEMQERFNKLMHTKTRVTFGTFHSVYFSILRHAYNFNASNIITEDKKYKLIKYSIYRHDLEPEDETEFIENILGEISRVKTEGININSYYASNCGEEVFRDIYREYEKNLRNERLIDFDDMLLYCKELLVARPDILKAWQNKYKYILIDEFQDINTIQYQVIKMLAIPENNIFIVGDDDQSIYGFRGAKPEIMLGFEKDYPDCKRVLLDTNYRSTSNIVNAAMDVINENKHRFTKEIKTVKPGGTVPDIREFADTNDEYDNLIKLIRDEAVRTGTYNDTAVLYRTNSEAGPMVRKFMEYNIPVRMKDSVPNIYDHWIARDINTYLRMAMGSRKRADFLQIINKPLRYIGRDYLTSPEITFEELRTYYEDKKWMIERVDRMEHNLKIMSKLNPYAAINYLRRGVGYDEYLSEYSVNKHISFEELTDVINEIQASAAEFNTFADWFSYISDYTEELKKSNSREQSIQDAVTFSTMHASKGLEYRNVFIIDANDGIIPHKKAVLESDIEEERRMFYVAITRAKENLHIFYSRERFNKAMTPTRFIQKILDRCRN